MHARTAPPAAGSSAPGTDRRTNEPGATTFPPRLQLLFSADHPSGALARANRAGTVLRLGRGVYCVPPDQDLPRWQQRRLLHDARIRALARTLPDDSVIGGYSAAQVLGATLLTTPATVDVYSPHGHSTRQQAISFRRHIRRLGADDITRASGIAVTSPLRTAVDCARQGTPDEALLAVDSLIRLIARPDRRQWFEDDPRVAAATAQLRALVDREAGYRGNSRARTILRWCDGWAESPLESRTRRAALIVGLPRPISQCPVVVRNRVYYPDLTFRFSTPAGPFVFHVEADGLTKFSTGETADRERRRDADLTSIGHGLAHVSTEMVRDPGLVDFRDLIRHKLPAQVRRSLRPVRELMTVQERRIADRQPWPFRD